MQSTSFLVSDRFLSVGHVARDEFGEEWRLGGSGLYCAATAARLGRHATLVTRVADRERPALETRCAQLEIALRCFASASTTTFSFSTVDGRRKLRLRARAPSLRASDIGALPTDAPVLLGSIVGEHADDLFGVAAGRSLLVAQGELRAFAPDGAVVPAPWRRADVVLPTLRAAVLSEEDLGGDLSPVSGWSARAPIVITRGERGASLFRDGKELRVPAFRPTTIVDPTGAGDSFAAGLLVALDEGQDWDEALRFANCVASFCLEGIATDGLADRARVEARLQRGERLG
jgi:sugar/nucleoside kinase (ribokinase family)